MIFQTVKTVVTVKMLNSRKQFYGIYHHRNMRNRLFRLGIPHRQEEYKMSKIDVVRAAMVEAMKAKDKERKDSLSMLLSALKNAQIDKREAPLTEDEENAIVKKEIKQVKETIDTAPADRADIIEEAKKRLAVYQEFAPADMTEDQIRETIAKVLAELGIEAPTAKDKGKIMKSLMPLVKGKADGKIVNEILAGFMK